MRNGSNDAVSCKDVPFGGLKIKKKHLIPKNPQKGENLAKNGT